MGPPHVTAAISTMSSNAGSEAASGRFSLFAAASPASSARCVDDPMTGLYSTISPASLLEFCSPTRACKCFPLCSLTKVRKRRPLRSTGMVEASSRRPGLPARCLFKNTAPCRTSWANWCHGPAKPLHYSGRLASHPPAGQWISVRVGIPSRPAPRSAASLTVPTCPLPTPNRRRRPAKPLQFLEFFVHPPANARRGTVKIRQ